MQGYIQASRTQSADAGSTFGAKCSALDSRPISRFLFHDETRHFPTHNVIGSRTMSYAVSVLDFEQCCKVVIASDVPDHPRPFAVQYATRAEALTSCMAADAARHLAIFWMILLSSAYEEIEHATHNFPQPYLEYANALQTCAYNWRSSACYSRVLPYAFCLRRARPRPNTQ